METKIENKSYYSSEDYDSDLESIFKKNWIYAGLTDELKEINDYIVIDAYQTSVIVQKTESGIQAFLNVCVHRHNTLFGEKKGNSPLVCKYHGWRFDDTGKLKTIPSRNSLEVSSKEFDCISLHKVSSATVGKFIFINLSKTPDLSLEDYLGHVSTTLSNISNSIGEVFERNHIDFAANWKLVIENTLEGYHINTVHPTTFTKLGITQNSKATFKSTDLHSEMVIESTIQDNGLQKMAKLYANKEFSPDGFFHILIFPNLLIGSTYGLSFYIANIFPHGPEASSFDYALYYSNKCPDVHSVKTMIGYSASEFTTTVLKEDREIVEQVQKGVKLINRPGILSNKEKRILEFQNAYLKQKYSK